MKKNAYIFLLLSILVPHSQAALITYTAPTNTWEYSDFFMTGIGNHSRVGRGVLAGDGGTVVGGGSHFLWNQALNGGGAGTYDFSTFTDYYFSGGYQVEVIGPIWTNTELRNNNQGEGIFGYQQLDATTLIGAPIANGTIVDGVFTYDNSGSSATWSYVSNRLNAVPEPASLVLFGLGLAGIGFFRKKKTT